MIRYYSIPSPYGFTWYADIYCGKCGASLPDIDPEGNEKHPIAGWELSDYATDYEPTCATCHAPINQWQPA